MSVKKKQAWKLSQTLSLEQVYYSNANLIFDLFLDQMTSALGERGVGDFEGSQLYLQIVIVISIFYALFPLQVRPLPTNCRISKP